MPEIEPLTLPDTKKCPYCAEDIKAEAIVCRHCGRDLATGQPAGKTAAPPPAEKKNPAIGLAGIMIAVFGAIICFGTQNYSVWPGVIVFAVGVGVLVWALATGNIKMFG